MKTNIEKEETTSCEVFRVNQSLANRVERHVMVLKLLENSKESKQKWLDKAIQEKLEKDESDKLNNIPKKQTLTVRLDKEIKSKLIHRVNMIKKLTGAYSKHAWVIDAIEEKLARESEKVEKFHRDNSLT